MRTSATEVWKQGEQQIGIGVRLITERYNLVISITRLTLGCYRRGPSLRSSTPTVLIGTEYSSTRCWNEVTAKVANLLTDEGVGNVHVCAETNEVTYFSPDPDFDLDYMEPVETKTNASASLGLVGKPDMSFDVHLWRVCRAEVSWVQRFDALGVDLLSRRRCGRQKSCE